MNYAIIVAAGSGTRMGSPLPKQFIPVNGKPLLAYSVSAFSEHPDIEGIVIVTSEEHLFEAKSIVDKYAFEKVIGVISGGRERKDSVRNGLRFLKERGVNDEDIVLIHDAARPLVTAKIISENIRTAVQYGAADTAIPSVDTVMIADYGIISSVPARSNVYSSQTPQSFRFGIIYDAHEKGQGREDITDDCQMALLVGARIHVVEGSADNFKITTKEDLERLKTVLNRRKK